MTRLYLDLNKAEQGDLFGTPLFPKKTAAPAPAPVQHVIASGGWGAIPGGSVPGGQRKRDGKGWVYRYPQHGGGYGSTPNQHHERPPQQVASEPTVLHAKAAQVVGHEVTSAMERNGWQLAPADPKSRWLDSPMLSVLKHPQVQGLLAAGVQFVRARKVKPDVAPVSKLVVAPTSHVNEQATHVPVPTSMGPDVVVAHDPPSPVVYKEPAVVTAPEPVVPPPPVVVAPDPVPVVVPEPVPAPEPAPVVAPDPTTQPATVAAAPKDVPLTVPTDKPQALETTGYVVGSRAEDWNIRNGNIEANPAIARKLVNKGQVLGRETNAEAVATHERALGTDPVAAYMKHKLLDAVTERPKDSPEDRALYMDTLGLLSLGLGRCKTAVDVASLMQEWESNMRSGYVEAGRLSENQLTQEYRSFLGDIHPAAQAEVDALPERTADNQSARLEALTSIRRKYAVDTFKVQNELRSRFGITGSHYPTLKRNADGSVSVLLSNPDVQAAWTAKFNVLGPKFSNLFGYGMKEGRHGSPHYTSTTSKAAPEMRAMIKEISAKPEANKWDWAGKKVARASTAPKSQSDDTDWDHVLSQAVLGDVVRKGPPTDSTGMTAPKLRDDFKFNVVEYGNWADLGERQWHTEAAHAAMADLASALSLPTDRMGLNGRVSLGFGSRGRGGKGAALAHYEPSTKVINLTKLSGKGSLAHEWGHALDHMLHYSTHPGAGTAVFPSDQAVFGTAAKVAPNLPPAVAKAMKDVMDTICYADADKPVAEVKAAYRAKMEAVDRVLGGVRTELYDLRKNQPAATERIKVLRDQHSALIDTYNGMVKTWNANRNSDNVSGLREQTPFLSAASAMKPYWSRPHEMFARCFEAHVHHKLAGLDRKNTYLVKDVDKPELVRADKGGLYPRGAHRVAISQKMDALIAAIKDDKTLEKAMKANWSNWLQALTGTPRLTINQ